MLPYAPWLVWFLPLAGALISIVASKFSSRLRDGVALAFSFSAVVMAVSMIPELLLGITIHEEAKWLPSLSTLGLSELRFGLLVDPLSIFMANVVSIISFAVMVYSIGYMKGESGLTRYWFLMNFFIANMLLLVMSDNFIQLLIGWEGVGLCSYALIGFWYSDEREHWVGGPAPTPAYPPSHCGMKAFIITRVGDAALLVAIFIIYAYSKTFSFTELQGSTQWISALGNTPGLITLVSLLFLGGPFGKSAQFPFHEWLPEAMAGPTSVSALIHAATMVNAGVYLIARVFPIFHTAYWLGYTEFMNFFVVLAWVGAFTAIMAATQAIVALELKKILAYSTISQIGYMMLALGIAGLTAEGVDGYVASIFHLLSHAVFKASLFLAAGAIIHATHSIYVTDTGGLRGKMQKTFWFMLIAALSLSGVPPLSGFWSKDAILVSAIEAGQYGLLAVAVATSAMTFFYTLRMIFRTFLGEPSLHLKEMEREGHHVHDSPKIMWIPYGALALGTIVIGLSGPFLDDHLKDIFSKLLVTVESSGSIIAPPIIPPFYFALSLSLAMLMIGGIPAYLLYVKRRADSQGIVGENPLLKNLSSFFWNRWHINSLYYRLFVNNVIAFGRETYSALETRVIDRAFNIILPGLMIELYNRFKRLQTGILSYNMVAVVLALLFIILMLTNFVRF